VERNHSLGQQVAAHPLNFEDSPLLAAWEPSQEGTVLLTPTLLPHIPSHPTSVASHLDATPQTPHSTFPPCTDPSTGAAESGPPCVHSPLSHFLNGSPGRRGAQPVSLLAALTHASGLQNTLHCAPNARLRVREAGGEAEQVATQQRNPSTLLSALLLGEEGEVDEGEDEMRRLLSGYMPGEPNDPKELLLVRSCLHGDVSQEGERLQDTYIVQGLSWMPWGGLHTTGWT
jgi:hypothetical protein